MKIFIIGPEGCGKSVFATMLYYNIKNGVRNGLCLRAIKDEGANAHKFFETNIQILENGEWPSRTIPGTIAGYTYKFELEYLKQTSTISVIDPPGHDIREELCDHTKNTLRIVDLIKETDMLIILVDPYEYQKAKDTIKRENAEIIENVLQLVTPEQKVIFAVSKADLFGESLDVRKWKDAAAVLKLVEERMKEVNWNAYRAKLTTKNCAVLAFSAVTSIRNMPQDNEMRRLPDPGSDKVLISKGLDFLIDEILRFWKIKRRGDLIRRFLYRIRTLAKSIIDLIIRYWKVLTAAIILYLGYYWLKSTFGF